MLVALGDTVKESLSCPFVESRGIQRNGRHLREDTGYRLTRSGTAFVSFTMRGKIGHANRVVTVMGAVLEQARNAEELTTYFHLTKKTGQTGEKLLIH